MVLLTPFCRRFRIPARASLSAEGGRAAWPWAPRCWKGRLRQALRHLVPHQVVWSRLLPTAQHTPKLLRELHEAAATTAFLPAFPTPGPNLSAGLISKTRPALPKAPVHRLNHPPLGTAFPVHISQPGLPSHQQFNLVQGEGPCSLGGWVSQPCRGRKHQQDRHGEQGQGPTTLPK